MTRGGPRVITSVFLAIYFLTFLVILLKKPYLTATTSSERNLAEDNHTVCIVTAEFKGLYNGGIGTAAAELSKVLSQQFNVHVVLLQPISIKSNSSLVVEQYRKEYGIVIWDALTTPGYAYHIHGDAFKRAFLAFQWLKEYGNACNVVVYHEWGGIGFFIATARQQGSYFATKKLVAVLHGPHLYALHYQRNPVPSVIDLQTDYMERQSVKYADLVISPSQYILDHIKRSGWEISKNTEVIVQPNPISATYYDFHDKSHQHVIGNNKVTELVFFGKTEWLKGLHIFCEAINGVLKSRPELFDGVQITFLARLHREIDGVHPARWFRPRVEPWEKRGITVNFIFDKNPSECHAYLK